MSATGYLDACGFIPASSGTGDFVVSAAITGLQTPASAAAVNSTVYSYRAESADKSQWEEGFGAYTVSTTTLARTTVTANSSGTTAKISFSAAPNVQVVAASADLQNASLLTGGTVGTARLASGTANSGSFLRGDQTWQTMPVVKAAVQFAGGASAATINGTATNVTSITRNGTGDYTINFTSALSDADYAFSVVTGPTSGGTGLNVVACRNASTGAYVAPTTTALRISFYETFASGAVADPAVVSVVVYE